MLQIRIEPGGVVPSGPTAEVVSRCVRLFVALLLREDVRVQKAYAAWHARAVEYEEAGLFTDAAAYQFLFETSALLNELVRVMKLERYQVWLPQALMFEFGRAAGAPV